jgi:hypothetical protein
VREGKGDKKKTFQDPVLRIRSRDPGSGAFLTPGSGKGKILKNPDPDPYPG